MLFRSAAGTGGDEAALFAADLFRMYQRYAGEHRWKFEIMELSDTGIGGYKEAIATITGKNVFARLKFESGVHRVQRVPATEASGRIHTSAATVAVLPEAEDVDIKIDEKDLRIDVFRASGPGGQSVNTTDSAVRITHIPTGVVVSQQDEKSQHKNRAKAMKILRARLYDAERQRLDAERAATRKGQVGSGDRSERIRTYNFPQSRVTDHRINLTLYKIERIMDGELDEVVDAVVVGTGAGGAPQGLTKTIRCWRGRSSNTRCCRKPSASTSCFTCAFVILCDGRMGTLGSSARYSNSASRPPGLSASRIRNSVPASIAAVESSKTMTRGVRITLRAIDRRWRCPPDKDTPRSPTIVR